MFSRGTPPASLPAYYASSKKTVEAVIALRGKDEEEPERLLRLSANTLEGRKKGVVTQNIPSCVDGSHKRKSASTPHGQAKPEHFNH